MSKAGRTRTLVVPIIIGINIAIFLLWGILSVSDIQFMVRNFLVSWTALAEGRFWTLVTSMFSHNMLWHILINMFVLYSFGPVIERVIGSFSFLKFYLIAGIVSSLSHAVAAAWIMHQPSLPALGASGAIAGVILVFALLFPQQKILIFGLIPAPALLGSLIFIGLDLWGLMAQAGGHGLPIGHGAHIGGAVTGMIYYLTFLRRRRNFYNHPAS